MNGGKPIPFELSNEDISAGDYMVSLDVQIKAVQHGNHHGFYLVQSTAKELPTFFCNPDNNKPPILVACEEKIVTVTMEARISVHDDFSQDKWFYIKSRASGLVIDVEHGFGRDHTKASTSVVLNHQKVYGSSACHALLEQQLWRLEDGYIINRRTGLVLEVHDFSFRAGAKIHHWTRNSEDRKSNQQWVVCHGFIHPKNYPNVVLDVDGKGSCECGHICLGKRKEINLKQRWSFEAVTFSWLASDTSYAYATNTDEGLLQEYESNHWPQSAELNRTASVNCKSGISDFFLEVKPHSDRTAARLMRDVKTMDVALTFGINGGARNIAVWAHRSVLEQEAGLAKLLSKLKSIEDPSTGSAAAAGIQSHHVTEYSLEAYCSLIRFLYSGSISIQVDLNDFAIGSPPNNPFSPKCKERPNVEGLYRSASPTGAGAVPDSGALAALSLVRNTTFSELFQLADCYAVVELRARCRTQIVRALNVSNALETLFGFAYRFEDLRGVVLRYVVNNLDQLYASNKKPFEEYRDHSERSTLLTEILELKVQASA
ncbi:hypothetical protein BG005_011893 [Podila minutissima]|nr:hypothetical protein BG005_011893 [Podila minutissima]